MLSRYTLGHFFFLVKSYRTEEEEKEKEEEEEGKEKDNEEEGRLEYFYWLC